MAQNRGVPEPTNDGVRRLWPAPEPQSLDDHDVLAAYPMPDGRPLLRVNFVSSVDGAVTLEGRSGGLGDAADRRVFNLLRVACDAVLVGAGTVRIERYGPMVLAERLRRLRRELGREADPVFAVVSRGLDLDPAHPLFTEAPRRPVLLTTPSSARRDGERFAAVADVLSCGTTDTEIDLGEAVAELSRRGLPHILCEGGPHLFAALVAADLVDELCLTFAPKLIGPGPGRIVAGYPSPVRSLALAQVLAAGDELFLHYTRPRPPSPPPIPLELI
jgi:riboflavin biosynthesis pyrimidine reductase